MINEKEKSTDIEGKNGETRVKETSKRKKNFIILGFLILFGIFISGIIQFSGPANAQCNVSDLSIKRNELSWTCNSSKLTIEKRAEIIKKFLFLNSKKECTADLIVGSQDDYKFYCNEESLTTIERDRIIKKFIFKRTKKDNPEEADTENKKELKYKGDKFIGAYDDFMIMLQKDNGEYYTTYDDEISGRYFSQGMNLYSFNPQWAYDGVEKYTVMKKDFVTGEITKILTFPKDSIVRKVYVEDYMINEKENTILILCSKEGYADVTYLINLDLTTGDKISISSNKTKFEYETSHIGTKNQKNKNAKKFKQEGNYLSKGVSVFKRNSTPAYNLFGNRAYTFGNNTEFSITNPHPEVEKVSNNPEIESSSLDLGYYSASYIGLSPIESFGNDIMKTRLEDDFQVAQVLREDSNQAILWATLPRNFKKSLLQDMNTATPSEKKALMNFFKKENFKFISGNTYEGTTGWLVYGVVKFDKKTGNLTMLGDSKIEEGDMNVTYRRDVSAPQSTSGFSYVFQEANDGSNRTKDGNVTLNYGKLYDDATFELLFKTTGLDVIHLDGEILYTDNEEIKSFK